MDALENLTIEHIYNTSTNRCVTKELLQPEINVYITYVLIFVTVITGMITLSFTSIEYKERCLLKKMKVVQYYYRYDLKNLKKLRKKRAQILNETGVWIGTKEKTTAEESKKNLRQRKAEGDKATSKKLPVKEPEKVEKVEKEKSVEQVQTQPAKPKETFKSSSSSSKKKGASKESKETSKSKETKSQ